MPLSLYVSVNFMGWLVDLSFNIPPTAKVNFMVVLSEIIIVKGTSRQSLHYHRRLGYM